jgi:hypothetical protein
LLWRQLAEIDLDGLLPLSLLGGADGLASIWLLGSAFCELLLCGLADDRDGLLLVDIVVFRV